MKVLFVAAELNPLAKVGGLADVIGALPKALKKLGVDVRLTIPKYGIVDGNKYPLTKVAQDISVKLWREDKKINLLETPLPDSELPVYLIDNREYLGENGIYFEKDASSAGSLKESQRFTFFVKSSLEIFEDAKFWPDIIHFHDWHVGILPVLLKIKAKKDSRYQKIKTLLTIHNMAFQGIYNPKEVFGMLGLEEGDWSTLSKRFGENNDINYLEQAVLNADLINTVSPTYSQEILTPEFGEGLEEVLKSRRKDLVGILNGIDENRFNPETDPNIKANYSSKEIDKKSENKKTLQKELGFEENPDTPLVGMISRLTDQKGLDLIEEKFENLMNKGSQFVLLGVGTKEYESKFKKLDKKYPKQFSANFRFDAALAQKIYAGSDIFLMPSRFEPCGLGQMISMRYGTLPIVRATGGLKDTVADFDPKTQSGTGFVFKDYTKEAYWAAVERALKTYQNQEVWQKIQLEAMNQDFSWEASAKKYLDLYHKLLRK